MRAALLLLLTALGCGRTTRDSQVPVPAPVVRPAVRDTTLPPRPSTPSSAPREDGLPHPADAAPAPADPLAEAAAAVVDRQHAAYNRGDLEDFLAAYADSVSIQALGDTVPVTGKTQLRESTRAWFAEAPAARVKVVERVVLGPFVVDRLRVSGGSDGEQLDAIGIYEVRRGLIRRVWTIPPPPTPH